MMERSEPEELLRRQRVALIELDASGVSELNEALAGATHPQSLTRDALVCLRDQVRINRALAMAGMAAADQFVRGVIRFSGEA